MCGCLVLFVFELDRVAAGALDAAVAPAAAAQGYVLVVATDLNLVTVGDDVAGRVDAGIDDGFAATGAGGFDFLNRVGQFQQAP